MNGENNNHGRHFSASNPERRLRTRIREQIEKDCEVLKAAVGGDIVAVTFSDKGSNETETHYVNPLSSVLSDLVVLETPGAKVLSRDELKLRLAAASRTLEHFSKIPSITE